MMSNEELTKLYSYDRFYIDKMNIRPFFLLSFLATATVSLTPFSDSTLTCSDIPQAGSINENLQFLWYFYNDSGEKPSWEMLTASPTLYSPLF
jgi:hypothetical protein